MKIGNDDELLTYEQAARLLNMSVATIRTYASIGKLQRIKIFDESRILKSDIEAHIIPGRSEFRADAVRRAQSL